jgi:predicted ribosomally synthesized peptide with nif11-like leader
MSVESVVKFFTMLDENESLQQECANVTDEAMRNALRDAVIGMAAKHGCEFTAEELSEHLDTVSEELSEEDLDQVAGGTNPFAGGRFRLIWAWRGLRFVRSLTPRPPRIRR